MPDGWFYKIDSPYWNLRDKAERDHPGLTFVRANDITTGLWRDVVMRTADGSLVTRRLFF